MILKASQRSGARELAKHLLNAKINEHIIVHDIRGFLAETLPDALEEAYAISLGTRCKQYLFSLSLNPPEIEDVPLEVFEAAIEEVERKLGFLRQPRIIVFHEKNGRRHCHVVWSRIDGQRMVAINMAHYKFKLQEISRMLFLKYGWNMPKGIKNGKDKERSSLSFSRQEWRQAERLDEDPKALKELFKKTWERADNCQSFAKALEEQGYYLAKGDRRGFVVLDLKGKVYSLTRWIDVSSRELKARLGNANALPDIGQAKTFLAARMTENLSRYITEAKASAAVRRMPLVQELRSIVKFHREDRSYLIEKQQKRWNNETLQRSQRLSCGLRGIWDRITGLYHSARKQNELETRLCLERDRKELHQLVRKQLVERQELQKTVRFYRQEYNSEIAMIKKRAAGFIAIGGEPVVARQVKLDVPAIIIAEKIAQLESRLSSITDDISTLQAGLEDNLLSDDMRTRIRILIERTIAAIQAKIQGETDHQQKNLSIQQAEIDKMMAEYNALIRQQAELQEREEQEKRRIAVNREFYSIICNMSCSLNGIPLYNIMMTVAPEVRLDEKVYVADLRQRSNSDLLNVIFKPFIFKNKKSNSIPQSLNPETAAPDLRKSVLQVKELFARGGKNRKPRGRKFKAVPSGGKAVIQF